MVKQFSTNSILSFSACRPFTLKIEALAEGYTVYYILVILN